MSKKVLATNCTIKTLPQDWSAKVNNTGTAIITVPENMAGIFGGVMEVKVCSINGFTCESFDGQNFAKLVGADADFDDSGFHDL